MPEDMYHVISSSLAKEKKQFHSESEHGIGFRSLSFDRKFRFGSDPQDRDILYHKEQINQRGVESYPTVGV
jgi:hypothetical protein